MSDRDEPYCEAQVGGMMCGRPVTKWGQQCDYHDPKQSDRDEQERTCKKCNETKPITKFGDVIWHGKFYYRYECRECQAARHRQDYLRCKDERLEYFRKYQSKNGKLMDKIRKERYPEKVAARKAVRNAVAGGRMKKLPCQDCGAEKTEFHHTHGYEEAYQLTGIWLCRKCHTVHHRKIREEKRNEMYMR